MGYMYAVLRAIYPKTKVPTPQANENTWEFSTPHFMRVRNFEFTLKTEQCETQTTAYKFFVYASSFSLGQGFTH